MREAQMHRLLVIFFIFIQANASLRTLDDLPKKLQVQHAHFERHDKPYMPKIASSPAQAFLLLEQKQTNYQHALTALLENKRVIKLLPSYDSHGRVVRSMSSLHAIDCPCGACSMSAARRILCEGFELSSPQSNAEICTPKEQQHPLELTQFHDRYEKSVSGNSSLLASSFHEIKDTNDQLLLSMSESYHEFFEQCAAKKLYEVEERVVNGGALYYQLHANKTQVDTEQKLLSEDDRKNYLRSIVDLMWYLYHESSRKKEAYQEGMLVLHDPESVVYGYLLDYARMVNPSLTGTLQDPALLHADNLFAYSRKTSHLKDINARAYAIDMRFDAHKPNKAELPAQKRTFFFEHDGNHLYIKLENYGLSWEEAPYHALELAIAQLRKIPLTKKYIGGDDQGAYKKERVPTDVISAAQQFLQKKNIDPKDKKYLYNLLKTIGIKAAFEPEVMQLGSSLIDTFDKNYDHLPLRRGRETILVHELSSALYYHLLVKNDPYASEIKQVFDGLTKIQRSLYDLKKDTVTIDQKKMLLESIATVTHKTLTRSRINLLMKIDQRIGNYVNTVCSNLLDGLSQSDVESQIKALTPRHGIFELVSNPVSRTQA